MKEVVQENRDRKPEKILEIFNQKVENLGQEELKINTTAENKAKL